MIGGNITAHIQLYTSQKNNLGEREKKWETIHSPKGFLDLSNGDSKYTSFNAKIQESTHIFICDYFIMDKRIKPEKSRLLIDGKVYDVMLIDDPMNLHQQYEIYLKFIGGQDGTS